MVKTVDGSQFLVASCFIAGQPVYNNKYTGTYRLHIIGSFNADLKAQEGQVC